VSRFTALRVRKLRSVHWFEEPRLVLEPETRAIVRTQHGLEVATALRTLPEGRVATIETDPFIKEIVRPVDDADRQTIRELEKKEQEAFQRGRRLVEEHRLPMRLLKTEYLFDQSRIIFYYKAETKVDFRDLLKSLASNFRTRIELRQIGVRDETKLLGGLGCCGKPVCCAQFMHGFHPVSTKMAKDQNLSLNPTKLSGICCRLLCCLAHEYQYYASFHGKFPKLGAEILVNGERGRVADINFIAQKILVNLPERRKGHFTLKVIKGRKDPGTGRNLWWVQEEGQPEPDVSLLLQPPPQARMGEGGKGGRPGRPVGGKGPGGPGGPARGSGPSSGGPASGSPGEAAENDGDGPGADGSAETGAIGGTGTGQADGVAPSPSETGKDPDPS